MSRRLLLAAALLALAAWPLAATGQSSSQRPAAELMDAGMWNREPIGGPFACGRVSLERLSLAAAVASR